MANPHQHLSPYDVITRVEDTLGARVLGVVASENVPDVRRDYDTLSDAYQLAINQIDNLQHANQWLRQNNQLRLNQIDGLRNQLAQLRATYADEVMSADSIAPVVNWVVQRTDPIPPITHTVQQPSGTVVENVNIVVNERDPLFQLKRAFFDCVLLTMTSVTDEEMTNQYGAWSTQQHPQNTQAGHPLQFNELVPFLHQRLRTFAHRQHEAWCGIKAELIARTFHNQVRAYYNNDRVDMTQNNCFRSKRFILDFLNNNLSVMVAF